jgi:hypothetical protein
MYDRGISHSSGESWLDSCIAAFSAITYCEMLATKQGEKYFELS